MGSDGIPPALSSIFGWVITGRVSHKTVMTPRSTALLSTSSTDSRLKEFQKKERLPPASLAHRNDVTFDKRINGRPSHRDSLKKRSDAPSWRESRDLTHNRSAGTNSRPSTIQDFNSCFSVNNSDYSNTKFYGNRRGFHSQFATGNNSQIAPAILTSSSEFKAHRTASNQLKALQPCIQIRNGGLFTVGGTTPDRKLAKAHLDLSSTHMNRFHRCQHLQHATHQYHGKWSGDHLHMQPHWLRIDSPANHSH